MRRMRETADSRKQNLTISLTAQTIRKAKILAVKRETSIGGLVAEQLEHLVSQDERYERAAASAIARMKHGFDLGGSPRVSRDQLHER